MCLGSKLTQIFTLLNSNLTLKFYAFRLEVDELDVDRDPQVGGNREDAGTQEPLVGSLRL